MTDEHARRTPQRLSDKTKFVVLLVVSVAVILPALQVGPMLGLVIMVFVGLPALFGAHYYNERRKMDDH